MSEEWPTAPADVSKLTIAELKKKVADAGLENLLPATQANKDTYVKLYLDHVVPTRSSVGSKRRSESDQDQAHRSKRTRTQEPGPLPSSQPDGETLLPAGSSSEGPFVITELNLETDCVTVKNISTSSQSLAGYQLLSYPGGQNFGFPDTVVLGSDQTTTVWAGAKNADKHAPPSHLFWTRRYIWNNTGDTAVLVNPAGLEVSWMTVTAEGASSAIPPSVPSPSAPSSPPRGDAATPTPTPAAAADLPRADLVYAEVSSSSSAQVVLNPPGGGAQPPSSAGSPSQGSFVRATRLTTVHLQTPPGAVVPTLGLGFETYPKQEVPQPSLRGLLLRVLLGCLLALVGVFVGGLLLGLLPLSWGAVPFCDSEFLDRNAILVGCAPCPSRGFCSRGSLHSCHGGTVRLSNRCVDPEVEESMKDRMGKVKAGLLSLACTTRGCHPGCGTVNFTGIPPEVLQALQGDSPEKAESAWLFTVASLEDSGTVISAEDGLSFRVSQVSMNVPLVCRAKLLLCETLLPHWPVAALAALLVGLLCFYDYDDKRQRAQGRQIRALACEVTSVLTDPGQRVPVAAVFEELLAKYPEVELSKLWPKVETVVLSSGHVSAEASPEGPVWVVDGDPPEPPEWLGEMRRYTLRPSAIGRPRRSLSPGPPTPPL